MPFTISHAAAVLPLHALGKSRLPLAALMIGSMSPDFAYLLPGVPGRWMTHSLLGVFWFCWPAALLTWLIFVRLLERPTIALLPEAWRLRIVPSDSTISLATLCWVSLAIILGALTHIIWDAFTHRWPLSDDLPVLRAAVFEVNGYPYRLYRVLQHLSTLVGAAVLAIWALRQLRRPPVTLEDPGAAPAVTNITRVAALFLLVATSGALAIAGYAAYPEISIERRLFHLAIGGMTGAALAWCAIALLVNRRLRANSRELAH